MDPTTAIIQFIGIVLFSTAVPNDPGLHAILPRIGHVHQRELKALPRPEAPDNFTLFGSARIENHVSVIMYRAGDRLNRTDGWQSDGRLANDWKYVVLDGERVQFLTNGINGEPSIPLDLPKIGNSYSCRPADQSLRPDYQPPYHGAVAVIDIPDGTLRSCETNTAATTARLDTRLRLKTRGVLVITGTKGDEDAKTIVLKGNAVVFVANIPPYALIEDIDLNRGDSHWMVYNSMLSKTCAARPQEDPTIDPPIPCDSEPLGESYVRARNKPPMDFLMIDSACSNTQWP
jgi:hypothetical protein